MNSDEIMNKTRTPQIQRESPQGISLAEEAAQVRLDVVRTLSRTGGGHYGGCMSVTDLLLTLYRRQLRICPDQPRHPERDRLILSKGHAALTLYSILRRLGFFLESLDTYAEFGSRLEGHPDMMVLPGVDFSSGSLGQGLSVAVGMALALRSAGNHVWTVLGDGECQEGQVWEAAMLASACKLESLIAVVDRNRYQEWGWAGTKEDPNPDPITDIEEKWRAFGWRVLTCDGHDFQALEQTFEEAAAPAGRPTVVIADTVKGKGVLLLEADPIRFHCGTATDTETQEMLKVLTCP